VDFKRNKIYSPYPVTIQIDATTLLISIMPAADSKRSGLVAVSCRVATIYQRYL